MQATGRDAKAQAVPLSPAVARGARRARSTSACSTSPRRCRRSAPRVRRDMALRGLPREKVLATVVHLLETTLIRVGNDDYARENNSYGLTTLRNRHVEGRRARELRFQFKGKSGKTWQLSVRDRRVAQIVRAVPGPAGPGPVPVPRRGRRGAARHLGRRQRLPARDHRREITAKDFRTWAGTVLAALALQEFEPFDIAGARRRRTSARRSSTWPRGWATRRHLPQVLCASGRAGCVRGRPPALAQTPEKVDALRPEEAATLRFLRRYDKNN